MGYSARMGYDFDKQALNQYRKVLDMTAEELALNLEVSRTYIMALLYSKIKAMTISDELLRRLSGLGISDIDIGVDRSKPKKRGRPRKQPPG